MAEKTLTPLNDCLVNSRLNEFPSDVQKMICLASGCSLCRNQNKYNPKDFTLIELENLQKKVLDCIENIKGSNDEYLSQLISDKHCEILPFLRNKINKSGIIWIKLEKESIRYRVQKDNGEIYERKLENGFFPLEDDDLFLKLEYFPVDYPFFSKNDPNYCKAYYNSLTTKVFHIFAETFDNLKIREWQPLLNSNSSQIRSTGIYLTATLFYVKRWLLNPKYLDNIVSYIPNFDMSNDAKIELYMAIIFLYNHMMTMYAY